MTKKQMNIFAPLFLLAIAALIFIVVQNKTNLHQDLTDLDGDSLANIYFYKDFLRDSEGLEKALTDPQELEQLLRCLASLEPSSKSAKSLTYQKSVKIRLRMNSEKPRDLEVKVVKTAELGDTAFVTIGILRGNGSFDGGNYESAAFLQWLNRLSEREEFASIWELH